MAGNITIQDATLVFRNFQGREGQFNREGDRNFCVLLDDDLAAVLAKDGWAVKELRAREEGDTTQKYIPVSVKYRGKDGNLTRPPTIVMITSKGRNAVDEDTCEFIDQIDIAYVDLIIRPYEWVVNGKSGIKAYLKSLYVTLAEDELAIKYRDVPEIGAGQVTRAITATVSDDNVIDVDSWEIDEDQIAIGS